MRWPPWRREKVSQEAVEARKESEEKLRDTLQMWPEVHEAARLLGTKSDEFAKLVERAMRGAK